MATLGSGYKYFKPSVVSKVQKTISTITRTPTKIAPPTTEQRSARLRVGSSSGGGSSGSSQAQVQPQTEIVDPIIEVQQVKPVTPSQQKIKSLGNLTLGKSTTNTGLGPQSLGLTTKQNFLLKNQAPTIPGTLLPGNQPTSTMTPAERAIQQGNIAAIQAQKLKGKNLLSTALPERFDSLEKQFVEKQSGITDTQKLFEQQAQATEFLEPTITRLDNQLNTMSNSFTKKWLGRELPPKEYAQALKELEQVKQIEKELNTKVNQQTGLYKKTSNTFNELENKVNTLNESYSKRLENRRLAKTILPDEPKKIVQPDTISTIPLSTSLGIKTKVSDSTKETRFQKEYQKTDVSTILNPEQIKLSQKQVKDIGLSRRALAGQLIASAETSLYLFPVTSIIGGALKGTKIVKILSKTRTAKKIKSTLTPTITYTKYSPITETRIVEGSKQFVIGKGKILYTQTGKITSKFGAKPSNKFIIVNYKFNVNELFTTIGKAGRKTPSGTPKSLIGLIPEENLIKLFTSQKTSTKALKGLITYKSEGIIQLQAPGKTLKEYKIVSDTSTGFARRVRVRTSPTDIFRLKGTTTTGSFKLSTTGEKLVGGKVKFFSQGDVTKATSRIRVEKGAKFDIVSTTTTGKAKDVFAIKKLKRFKSLEQVTRAKEARETIKILKQKGEAIPPELTKISQGFFVSKPKTIPKPITTIVNKPIISSGKTTQTIVKETTKTIPKTTTKTVIGTQTPIVTALQKTSKKYLDVYGFQNYQRVLSGLTRSAKLTTLSLTRINKQKIDSFSKTKNKTKLLSLTKTSTLQKYKTSQLTKSKTLSLTKTKTLTDTKTLTKQLTSQKTLTGTKTLARTKTLVKTQIVTRPITPRLTPYAPTPFIPIIGRTLRFKDGASKQNNKRVIGKKFKITNRTQLKRFWAKKKTKKKKYKLF